jgi:hypothetical protein
MAEAALASVDAAWMGLVEETLKRLRVLAATKAGDRINTRMHYVYHNRWHAWVYRSFVYTETREHTVAYVRQTVAGLSAVASRVVAQSWVMPPNMLALVRDAARGAAVGLQQLCATYADDIGCVATLASLAVRLGVVLECLGEPAESAAVP